MSNLLQEAIADANKVKEIAYQNAKAAIEEAFQPKIQRMISTKLAEEDFEDEMPPEMEADPVEDEFADEMPVGESYIEDGKNGTPDNPIKNNDNPQTGLDEEEIDEEFDKIIRELEGNPDDLEEQDDAYDEDVPAGKNLKKEGDLPGHTPSGMPTDAYDEKASRTKKNIGEMDMPVGDEEPSDEEEIDDLNLEALIRKLEEEEFGTSQEPSTQSAGQSEIDALRAENARLKQENRDAFKAIAELKGAMNEVNLLNSKLMFSSKIIQSFELSESQQVKILETFDRAQSLREVKLIYATIQEHYRGRQGKKSLRPMTESASRTIKTVKGNNKPASKDNTLMEGAERWQVLSGLKPIND